MDITLERIFSLMEHKENGKIARGAKARFARSIGYDSGDIVSMWENGSSKSYLKKLHEISAKYGVSVEWLQGKTDEKNLQPLSVDLGHGEIKTPDGENTTGRKKELIQLYEKLTPEQQDFFLAQLQGVVDSQDK